MCPRILYNWIQANGVRIPYYEMKTEQQKTEQQKTKNKKKLNLLPKLTMMLFLFYKFRKCFSNMICVEWNAIVFLAQNYTIQQNSRNKLQIVYIFVRMIILIKCWNLVSDVRQH